MTEIVQTHIAWLRSLADRGGKGVVTPDARSLGRIADALDEQLATNTRLRNPRPGNSLCIGLWAAPEEPTCEMRAAGKRAMPAEVDYWQKGGVLHAKPRPDNECVPPESVFKAMRRAVGGDDG